MSDKVRLSDVAAGSKARQILVDFKQSNDYRGFQEAVSAVTGISGPYLSACWGKTKKTELLRPDDARKLHQSYPDFPLDAYIRAYIELVLTHNLETKDSVQLIEATVDAMSDLVLKADKYDKYRAVIQLLEAAEEQYQAAFPIKMAQEDSAIFAALFNQVLENERQAMVDQPRPGVNGDILRTRALATVEA